MTTRGFKTALCLAGVFFGILFAGVGAASAQSDTLWTNQALYPGQYLLSQNGHYQFIFQTDGNVVLYDMWNNHRALWATNTVNQYYRWGNTRSDHLLMQSDGNLVLSGYHSFYGISAIVSIPNPPYARWASGSNADWVWQYHADPTLVMQNDGNLVIYVFPLTSGAFPIWASGT